jgi:hypothetical protein
MFIALKYYPQHPVLKHTQSSVLQQRDGKAISLTCVHCEIWKHQYDSWMTLTIVADAWKLSVSLNKQQNDQGSPSLPTIYLAFSSLKNSVFHPGSGRTKFHTHSNQQ